MSCSLYFCSALTSHTIKVSRVLSLKSRNRKEPPRGQQYWALLWKQVCCHQLLRTATSSTAVLRCGDSHKRDRLAPLMLLISCLFFVVEVWRKEKHCFRAWISLTGQRQHNPKGNISSKPFPSAFLPLQFQCELLCMCWLQEAAHSLSSLQTVRTNTGSLHNMSHCTPISVTCTLKPTLAWKPCSIKGCLICLDLPNAILVIPGSNLTTNRLNSTSPLKQPVLSLQHFSPGKGIISLHSCATHWSELFSCTLQADAQ